MGGPKLPWAQGISGEYPTGLPLVFNNLGTGLLNLGEPRGCYRYSFDYSLVVGVAGRPVNSRFQRRRPPAFATGGRRANPEAKPHHCSRQTRASTLFPRFPGRRGSGQLPDARPLGNNLNNPSQMKLGIHVAASEIEPAPAPTDAANSLRHSGSPMRRRRSA